MTTGDLKNNMQKLKCELKALHVEKDVDFEGLSKGLSQAFLPIYHYAFIDYSRAVAQQITDLGCVLENKSDLRFLEGMYKVLRELFSYKPLVNKEQFFSPGFVERKVIMATDVLTRIRMLNKSLAPKMPARSAPRHHARNSSVNRVSSERVMTRSQSPMTKEGRNTPTRCSTPDEAFISAAAAAKRLQPNLPCVLPVRHHSDTISPVSISPPLVQPACMYQSQYRPQCYASTPTEIDTMYSNQVAALNLVQSGSPESFSPPHPIPPSGVVNDHMVEGRVSPLTYTNGFSAAVDVRLHIPPSDISLHDGHEQSSALLSNKEVALMLQNVRELNTRVANLERTVAVMVKSERHEDVGTSSDSTIENLSARLTLLENRLADCESKKSTIDHTPVHSMKTEDIYNTCPVGAQPKLQCSGDCELSPRKEDSVPSPRRNDLAEGDYAAMKISTDATYEGGIATSGQALRINNLLKQTEELLEKKPLQREIDVPNEPQQESCN